MRKWKQLASSNFTGHFKKVSFKNLCKLFWYKQKLKRKLMRIISNHFFWQFCRMETFYRLVGCISTNFNSLIKSFKRINKMWMNSFNLLSRTSHRLLNWNELEISFWFTNSFRLKHCSAFYSFLIITLSVSRLRGGIHIHIVTQNVIFAFSSQPFHSPLKTSNTEHTMFIRNTNPLAISDTLKMLCSWFQKILHASTGRQENKTQPYY